MHTTERQGMTTHTTKTWIEDGKLITEFIPEAEIYKREWVGLTLADMENLAVSKDWLAGASWAAAKLKEKNA
jgi:hypothetical protein